MKLRDMAREWLSAHGYDGLCNPTTECGCGLDNLMPCGEPGEDCVSAKADGYDDEYGIPMYVPSTAHDADWCNAKTGLDKLEAQFAGYALRVAPSDTGNDIILETIAEIRQTCAGCAGRFNDAECRHPNVNKQACHHKAPESSEPQPTLLSEAAQCLDDCVIRMFPEEFTPENIDAAAQRFFDACGAIARVSNIADRLRKVNAAADLRRKENDGHEEKRG